MTDIYAFTRGTTPLLISVPHDGRALKPGQSYDMTEVGQSLPDTDWHVRRLYRFAIDLGASIVAAHYSRYVVDLNRSADDVALYEGQVSTGLCPAKSFAGDDLYNDGASVSDDERARRVRTYWQPYHQKIADTLAELKEEFGYALLWDGHSIRTEVPSLFPGELPDLNIGTNGGASCGKSLLEPVEQIAAAAPFSSVVNGRFKGGYITRHYGAPEQNIHAIQLEIAQRTYMDEESTDFDEIRAEALQATLADMLNGFTSSAA